MSPAFLQDRTLFTHVALAAASFEFFSALFTAQSLKATLYHILLAKMETSAVTRTGLELNFLVVARIPV